MKIIVLVIIRTRQTTYFIPYLCRFLAVSNCLDVANSFVRSTRETFQGRSNDRALRHHSFICMKVAGYVLGRLRGDRQVLVLEVPR